MIRVLIVDDSVAFRMFLRRCLMTMSDVEVVGVARDGIEAMEKVKELRPDVITLDMNMPRMNGMETLQALKRDHPHIAVIIVAAETEGDADRTVQALKAGAFDFIVKPQASDAKPMESIQQSLGARLNELRPRLTPQKQAATAAVAPASPLPMSPRNARPNILAIGASTGGPAALHTVLAALPAALPVPVIVVQHMPDLFIRSLAARMDKDTPPTCSVAQDGERLKPGHVYFAPGDQHLQVHYDYGALSAHLDDSPPLHFCRPAVDASFLSLAALAPQVQTLAVVLTGMGKDGAAGALELARHGAFVIAQDKATSTVWGMPGATVAAGAAHRVLPLTDIAGAITAQTQSPRSAMPAMRASRI
jgi:two-component system chemotaxis response regulator CheB